VGHPVGSAIAKADSSGKTRPRNDNFGDWEQTQERSLKGCATGNCVAICAGGGWAAAGRLVVAFVWVREREPFALLRMNRAAALYDGVALEKSDPKTRVPENGTWGTLRVSIRFNLFSRSAVLSGRGRVARVFVLEVESKARV
jgi:hypothetical protein